MKRVLWLGLVLILMPGLLWAQSLGAGRANNILRTYVNDTSTGTADNLLAKVVPGTGGNSKVIKATTSDTSAVLVLVRAGGGTSGIATVIHLGEGSCVMDATNASGVANQPVVASTTTAGRCHTQVSPPTNGMQIGTMISDATTSGSTAQILFQNVAYVPGGASGTGTVNAGNDKALACYSGNGTTVDDCVQIGTAGKYPKSNGTDFTLSTGSAAGTGTCTNQFMRASNADAAPTCNTVVSTDTDNTIAKTGTDINTSSQVTQVSGSLALIGDLTPTALSGNVNDYNPSNLSTALILRIDGGAANRDITGIAGGSDGRVLVIRNVGSTNALTLKEQSASSSATNRFSLTADVILQPGMSFALLYDATLTRWTALVNVLPKPMVVKLCDDDIGDVSANAAPLTDDQDSPTSCGNRYGRDVKLTAMLCKVDGGSTTILPILTGGSTSSILSGGTSCTCGTSWTACTLNGGPIVHSFDNGGTSATCTTTPCTLDDNITTAGGTAKRLQRSFIGELQ